MNTRPAYSHSGLFFRTLVRSPWAIVAIFVGFGALGLILYYDMPIVRNSLLYARIAHALVDNGGDFSVEKDAFNKALGFPFLSFPMVVLFGANIGLKISSFIWTALWAVSAVFFFRRINSVAAWDTDRPLDMGLLLVILFLNPLVYYQFLSAYPDSLNALAFMWALYFLDRMLSKGSRLWDGVMFFVVVLVNIWIKHHGFVLFAILLIFCICRWRLFSWLWANSRKNLIVSIGALALALLGIGLAQAAHVALFNLSHNQDNYSRGFGNLWTVVGHNAIVLKDYLWLSFTFFVPLLFRWKAFVKHKEWYITLLVFVATVLVYRGARYNIRYFLPVAPLFAWIIYNNLSNVNREIRYLLLGAFLAANLFYTLYYNNVWIKENIGYFYELEGQDNLRLADEQYDRKKDIDEINKHVTSKRNTLFFARSYYKEGSWYVWERDGLFSDKLKIEYLREPDWEHITQYAKTHGLEEALLFTRSKIDTSKRHNATKVKKLTNTTYLLTF